MGRRRPWILLAQSLLGLSILVLAFVPDLTENFRLLSIAILVVNVFASVQDVSTDALAVDLLQEKERGNGWFIIPDGPGPCRVKPESRSFPNAIAPAPGLWSTTDW